MLGDQGTPCDQERPNPPISREWRRVSGTKLSSLGDVITYGLKRNWKVNWYITVSRYAAEMRHRLHRVLEHLELDDITFHTYRHTTASRLVQRGVDLRRVQVWMGHKAIATTIRYAKLAPNDLADLANVLEAA